MKDELAAAPVEEQTPALVRWRCYFRAVKPMRSQLRLYWEDVRWSWCGGRLGGPMSLEHLPTGVQVTAEVPGLPRSAGKKEARRLRQAVFRDLVDGLEEGVARELCLPGRQARPADRPRMDDDSIAAEVVPRAHSELVWYGELFTCADARAATVLFEAMVEAGLRVGRQDEVVAVSTDAPTRAEQRRLRTRMISAALASDAEWVLGGHGPRQGTRGAFTAGPTHRARARRRGKKGNRRRVRHATAQALRTGIDRPAQVKDSGARMPRQTQSPFLDLDDFDPVLDTD